MSTDPSREAEFEKASPLTGHQIKGPSFCHVDMETIKALAAQNREDVKKRRNRLAQRKHRERKKARNEQEEPEDNQIVKKPITEQSHKKIEKNQNEDEAQPVENAAFRSQTSRALRPFSQHRHQGSLTEDKLSHLHRAHSLDSIQGTSLNRQEPTPILDDFDFSLSETRPFLDKGYCTRRHEITEHSPTNLWLQDYPPTPTTSLCSYSISPPTVNPTTTPLQSPIERQDHFFQYYSVPSHSEAIQSPNLLGDTDVFGNDAFWWTPTSIGSTPFGLPAQNLEQTPLAWQSQIASPSAEQNPHGTTLCTIPENNHLETLLQTPITNSASSPAQRIPPRSPSIFSPSSSVLETKFEQIIDLVEEYGFDSIDDMASKYYSAKFTEESTCEAAQSLSRRRHLRTLLEDTTQSSKNWSPVEAQCYQDGIINSAVNICFEELDVSKAGVRNEALSNIREVAFDADIASALREEKRIFRKRMPETWSLLTELACSAGLSQAQSSQAAGMFLYMLHPE